MVFVVREAEKVVTKRFSVKYPYGPGYYLVKHCFQSCLLFCSRGPAGSLNSAMALTPSVQGPVPLPDTFKFVHYEACTDCREADGRHSTEMPSKLPPANEVCECYIFTPVCHSVHSGEYLGRYTPWQVHPSGRYTPGQVHPPGRYNPGQVHPPGRYTPLGRYTPTGQVHPPGIPPAVDARIRSTSGRYVSYWNAFLFLEYFCTSMQGT